MTRFLIGQFEKRTVIGPKNGTFLIGSNGVMKLKRGPIFSSLLIGGRFSVILIGRRNGPMGEQFE